MRFVRNSISDKSRRLKKPIYTGGRRAITNDIEYMMRMAAALDIMTGQIGDANHMLLKAAQIINDQQSAINVLQATVRGISRQDSL